MPVGFNFNLTYGLRPQVSGIKIATVYRRSILIQVEWPIATLIFSLFYYCFQGQKGEPGSSAKSRNGTMQFTETADNCTLHTAGTVRYNASQKALELCDGSTWLPLMNRRGRHCLDILNSGELSKRNRQIRSASSKSSFYF